MCLTVRPEACSTIFSAGWPGSITTASLLEASDTTYPLTSRSRRTLTMDSFPTHQYLQEMEKAAVVGFTLALLLICLFWAYGYFRRRTRRPSGAPSGASRHLP